MDYKLKLIEFISKWNTYRSLQQQLLIAREAKDVKKVKSILTRINTLIKEIDADVIPTLNTLNADLSGNHLTLVKGGDKDESI